MRLLHVVPSYLPATRYGGPIYSVHALCRALAKRDGDVHVYTTNVDGPGVSAVPLGRAVDLDGVKVWYFPTAGGRRIYRSPDMGRALAANVAGFDALHLHSVFLWPILAAARAARRAGVPYVLAPRGMLVGDLIRRTSPVAKSLWIRFFERKNVAGAATVHVTSEIEAMELAKLGMAARRIVVVPNGIDLPPPPLGLASATNPTVAARPFVLCLSRISWKKGLDRLIRAMTYVPEADLIIAGNDEETLQPSLEALARDLGLAARVRFLGPVHGDVKWSLIRAAAIFALPSYSENFGIAVLEAMACGRPVVVTPEVGLACAIRETGAGLVVDGAPERLGPALSSLLADREKREHMGAAGARAARDRFSWEVIAARMEAVYRECLTMGPTRV